MPLVRIDLRKGKSGPYRQAICNAVYSALRETFNVPDEDRFFIVNEHDDDNFQFSRNYLGIGRSADFVIVQMTVSDTRNRDQKKALFKRTVDLLAANPGLRREDVFISLVEVKTDDWSFGNGIAQYV